MLTEIQIVILAVVIRVVTVDVTYCVILYYLKEHERNKSVLQETRKSAFAISRNLVQEFPSKFPITTNYRLTKILFGRGSSAEFFVGENILNTHRYAINVIDLWKKDIIWRYEREKHFLKDIKHSNVIRLFEVYNTSKKMFFVMELYTGGYLGHLIRKHTDGFLPELKASEYILQITRAIMHYHDHGICHHDIKLENILLENNSTNAQIKIVDFGNANPVKTGMRDPSILAIAFSMPVKKIKKIFTLFQEIDCNGNGSIEKEEFRAAMQHTQSKLSTKDIDTLFDSIDQNGDGSMSFLEFVAVMIDPREVDIKQRNQAFKLIDKDCKGYLTKEDLVGLLCNKFGTCKGFDLRKSLIQNQTNPKLYFENQKQKQHASDGTYAIGRGTLNESEKKWLFAMAEGSLRFEDLTSSTSAPTTPTSPAKGNTSIVVVPSFAPPS